MCLLLSAGAHFGSTPQFTGRLYFHASRFTGGLELATDKCVRSLRTRAKIMAELGCPTARGSVRGTFEHSLLAGLFRWITSRLFFRGIAN